jgi:hypothetical protein
LSETAPPDERDEGEWGSPSGTPIGRALQIRQTPLAEDLYRAVRTVSVVHGDGPLPAIPLSLAALGEGIRGRFRFDADGPISIAVNRAYPHRGFSAVHEIGHFLDFSGIGEPNTFASESSAELGAWLSAVRASRGYRELDGAVESILAYSAQEIAWFYVRLLSPSELWARSYAQYIAVRSADPELLVGLAEHQAAYPDHLKGIARLLHWTDDDFAPIAAEVEALAWRLGWRSGR